MSTRLTVSELAVSILICATVRVSVSGAASVPQQTFCVSCVNTTPTLNEFGFLEISMGQHISSWIPIDVEHDGTFEFAVTIVGVPGSAGLYDPGGFRWLDDFRGLPAGTLDWAVKRSADNQLFEYYFLVGRNLLRYDTHTNTLDSVWSFGYNARTITLWGHDASEHQTIAATGDSTGHFDGTGRFLRVHQLETGNTLLTLPCGNTKPRLVETNPVVGNSALAVYHSRAEYWHSPELPGFQKFYHWLSFFDEDWNLVRLFDLPYWQGYSGPPKDLWGLNFLDLGILDDDSSGLVTWLTQSHAVAYGELQPMQGAFKTPGGYLWHSTFWPSNIYSGLALYDFDAHGNSELILPMADGSGWQLRNPITGSVIRTESGLPPVSVFTYPLSHPGRSELFYIDNSTLNIFLPEGLSNAGTNGSVLNKSVTVEAYPNPFNSSVTMTWSSAQEIPSISIHNILGQPVQTFDESDLFDKSSVTWDGLDGRGRPVASGVYFARLSSSIQATTVKLVLVR